MPCGRDGGVHRFAARLLRSGRMDVGSREVAFYLVAAAALVSLAFERYVLRRRQADRTPGQEQWEHWIVAGGAIFMTAMAVGYLTGVIRVH